MTKYIAALFALLLLCATSQVCLAADDAFTCALATVQECFPDEGCTELSTDEMGLPRFVRIDLKNKSITSLDKAVTRTSKIDSIDRLEEVVVMHGTELRGWSIALGLATGNLTLTAAGDAEGFVVFGSCILP